MFSTANTHYAAFVTGYFMAPLTTALECIQTSATALLPASNSLQGLSAPACPAGYSITGGGCRSSYADARLAASQTQPSGFHYCAYLNAGTQSITISAHSSCCRVPGR